MKLVLLPGLDGTGELFAPFVEALDGFPTQIVAYPLNRAMSYAEHESFVRDKLPADDDFVLLAESFSGPIGISIAAAAPPRLRGLVLCCTFASNPLPVFGPLAKLIGKAPALRIPPALMAPWLYAGRGTPELRRAHVQAMARVAPSTIRARVASILGIDHGSLLRRIEVPLLYLRATADRLIPASVGRGLKIIRPDMEIVEIDAPHFLLQTEPVRCAAVTLSFISRCIENAGMQTENPDPPLTADQALRVSRLTQADLQEMDRVLLAQAAGSWRKVARIVGTAIGEHSARIPDVPDVYYAQRVRHLAEVGKLESRGDLRYMRHSEVRLPQR
jgi:pimeloyl-[acyl-carrier protein] methyl ester esterase